MFLRRITYSWLVLMLMLVFSTLPANASPQESKLGKIEFPTSGSAEAQRHFLRGVGALHSFWYEEAIEAFRKSTAVDPDFMMGYWGEAMAHNHPIWREQNLEAAKTALGKIMGTENQTARERAYLNSVKLLFGKGDKRSRDHAYSNAMKEIYQEYPKDLEGACFYALSLLGLARGSEQGHQLQIRAGAITLEVFQQNSDHPCAAHYTIHAFDHPDLAILALPAARRYAQIAPASHHAQHMPAHIFVQLGMWPEATASNEAGWRDSVAWVKREGMSMGQRDYHSLQWLHYVYLQQGRYNKAYEIFNLKLKDMSEAGSDPHALDSGYERRVNRYYERMAAASVFETEQWESAATLEGASGSASSEQAVLTFTRGFAAAVRGQSDVDRHLEALKVLRREPPKEDPFYRNERLDVWKLEIQAAVRTSSQDYEESIALMKKAIALEEALPPPSGPPRIVKPTHELLGEIFLQAKKPNEAAQQFATSLLRHPNRARSLLGAARAATQSGHKESAREFYSTLLEVWAQADPELPDLREAKDYLQKIGESQ